MSIFNLKKLAAKWKPAQAPDINLDEHITMRLKEQHADAPDKITERQLDDNRFEAKDFIMEKQLEKARTGSADMIIERNLTESKGKFGDLRNSKTSEGDINKLEEKRLAGDRAELEKYEAAAQTPKALKWWEHLRPSGNAKSAGLSNSLKKTAFGMLHKETVDPVIEKVPEEHVIDFDAVKNLEGDEIGTGLPPDSDPANEFMAGKENPEGPSLEEEQDVPVAAMKLITQKEMPELDSMYFVLGFSPSDFEGKNDTQLKEVALNKILSLKPGLRGKISIDDFAEPEVENKEGKIALRLVGQEYFSSEAQESEFFRNLKLEHTDEGGTPVTLGMVELSDTGVFYAMDEGDRENFASELEEYIISQHPEMAEKFKTEGIRDYLNFSDAKNGKIKFAIGAGKQEDSDELDEDDQKEYDEITGEKTDEGGEESPVSDESFPVVEHPMDVSRVASMEDFQIVIADANSDAAVGSKKN